MGRAEHASRGAAGTTTVVDCSGVGGGGITRVLSGIVRNWPAGHRLRLVAVPWAWEVPPDTAADVETLGRQASGRARTIAAATLALHRATAPTRGGTVRVLSLSPSLAAAGSRRPVTTIVHDLAFRLWPHGLPAGVRSYRRLSYALAVRRSARLVCVSARTRHDLFGLYGVPAARCRVWHPGSDLPAVAGRLPDVLARVHERGGRYLAVAGHAPHKGVELAIEAMPQLPGGGPGAGPVLAVLTGGRRVDRFAALAATSALRDRIVFVDHLPDADYAATVAGAAVFLVPSHFEGYGLPAAEALRLGTPTVISPDPALHEAAGAGAVRMESWTAGALARAVTAAESPGRRRAGAAPEVGRSWREATAHLFDLLGDAAPGRLGPRRTPAGR